MENPIPNHLRQHFYHLYAIALADLSVTSEELEMLISFGHERGITRADIQRLLLSTAPFHSDIPSDPHEQIHCLYDMCRLALADSIVTYDERCLLERIILLFGYDKLSATSLLDRLLILAKSEVSVDQAIQDIMEDPAS